MLINQISLFNFNFIIEYFLLSVGLILVLTNVALHRLNKNLSSKFYYPMSRVMTLVFLMSGYLILNDISILPGFTRINPHVAYSSVTNDGIGSLVRLIVCIFSSIFFYITVGMLEENEERNSEFLLLFYFAFVGLLLLCTCNDLPSAFLAIELVSISSYLLACFKKESSYSVEAGLKYFVIGSISSAFFLYGCSFLYATTGTLSLNEMHHFFSHIDMAVDNSNYALPHASDFENLRSLECNNIKTYQETVSAILKDQKDCIESTKVKFQYNFDYNTKNYFDFSSLSNIASCNQLEKKILIAPDFYSNSQDFKNNQTSLVVHLINLYENKSTPVVIKELTGYINSRLEFNSFNSSRSILHLLDISSCEKLHNLLSVSYPEIQEIISFGGLKNALLTPIDPMRTTALKNLAASINSVPEFVKIEDYPTITRLKNIFNCVQLRYLTFIKTSSGFNENDFSCFSQLSEQTRLDILKELFHTKKLIETFKCSNVNSCLDAQTAIDHIVSINKCDQVEKALITILQCNSPHLLEFNKLIQENLCDVISIKKELLKNITDALTSGLAMKFEMYGNDFQYITIKKSLESNNIISSLIEIYQKEKFNTNSLISLNNEKEALFKKIAWDLNINLKSKFKLSDLEYIVKNSLDSKGAIAKMLEFSNCNQLEQLLLKPELLSAFDEFETAINYDIISNLEIRKSAILTEIIDCIDLNLKSHEIQVKASENRIKKCFLSKNLPARMDEIKKCFDSNQASIESKRVDLNMELMDVKIKYFSTFSDEKLLSSFNNSLYSVINKHSSLDSLMNTNDCSALLEVLVKESREILINSDLSENELKKLKEFYLNLPDEKFFETFYPEYFSKITNGAGFKSYSSYLKNNPACTDILKQMIKAAKYFITNSDLEVVKNKLLVVKKEYYSNLSDEKILRLIAPSFFDGTTYAAAFASNSCSTCEVKTSKDVSELLELITRTARRILLASEFNLNDAIQIKKEYYTHLPAEKMLKVWYKDFLNIATKNGGSLRSFLEKNPGCEPLYETLVSSARYNSINDESELFELVYLKKVFFLTLSNDNILKLIAPSIFEEPSVFKVLPESLSSKSILKQLIENSRNLLMASDYSIDQLEKIEKDYYSNLPKECFKFKSVYYLDNSSFKLIKFGLLFILFSVFIKLALAPFHLWSLDVYEGSPTVATFFFSVMTKLSLFMFLVRFCYTAMPAFISEWQFYSIWIAVISVFVGSFGGLKQRKLKTLFAYSSINHTGYSLLAFSMGSFFGIKILIIYLIIYMVSGVCIWFSFLLLKLKKRKNKKSKELSDLSLLGKSNPALAFSLAITFFSVAGLPPFVGFITKMGVFITLLLQNFYFFCISAVLCSVVSTFYYIRIVKTMFFENTLVGKLFHSINSNKVWLLSLFTFLLVFIFVNPKLLFLIVHLALLN